MYASGSASAYLCKPPAWVPVQDLRMDQLEGQHREERRRLEEAALRAARDSEAQEKQLLEGSARQWAMQAQSGCG